MLPPKTTIFYRKNIYTSFPLTKQPRSQIMDCKGRKYCINRENTNFGLIKKSNSFAEMKYYTNIFMEMTDTPYLLQPLSWNIRIEFQRPTKFFQKGEELGPDTSFSFPSYL